MTDTEMLDWLEENEHEIENEDAGDGTTLYTIWHFTKDGFYCYVEAESLRECIQKAMEESK